MHIASIVTMICHSWHLLKQKKWHPAVLYRMSFAVYKSLYWWLPSKEIRQYLESVFCTSGGINLSNENDLGAEKEQFFFLSRRGFRNTRMSYLVPKLYASILVQSVVKFGGKYVRSKDLSKDMKELYIKSAKLMRNTCKFQ